MRSAAKDADAIPIMNCGEEPFREWERQADSGLGGEVAFFGTSLVAAVSAIEIDTSEGSVFFEIGGGVGEGVLAAQFFLNFFEAVGHFLDGGREEDAAASALSHLCEDLVSFAAAGSQLVLMA